MKIPSATYRLQFRDGMTFDRAADLVAYLSRLGVSHLYASPIFAATTGSTHGYDVTDHNAFDPSLGGEVGFHRLTEALRRYGLGLILDIVPNHMAASLENPWWRDVIARGKDSAYAGHFDIDWSERLTLPILGEPFGDLVAAGEVSLSQDGDEAFMEIPGHRLPLSLGSRHLLPDDPKSASQAVLEAIHAAQHWQLVHWTEARRHLTYRRFFEVTGLVGVRVEEEQVFRDVHRLTLDLVHRGLVDGLRIDHVDGLADPAGYLRRLRAAVGPEIYITVEKILGLEERLPETWPVQGTTGYEFSVALADLLVDRSGLNRLRNHYAEYTQASTPVDQGVHAAKLEMLRHNFEGELSRLAAFFADHDPSDMQSALAELIAALPVYRTYIGAEGIADTDRAILDKAAATAVDTGTPEPQFAAILARLANPTDDFAIRFQQLSGPVMAKSVEDTFFYRHHPLIALNEVGAEPGGSPSGREGFHKSMAERLATQPHGLSATATHDTKRGEDARARLYAIAEDPDGWRDAVARWDALLPSDGVPAKIRWMIYQSLAGFWPARTTGEALERLSARFAAYLEKALREAKEETSWTSLDTEFEARIQHFARSAFSAEGTDFRRDFEGTIAPIIQSGQINSMTQTLAKLLAPGIPDVYQGSEHEDLSLVDPDNRRIPDFERLARNLDGSLTDRLTKQHLIAVCLKFRRARPTLFSEGEYIPIDVTGAEARHVVAFARRNGKEWLVAAGLRLPRKLLSSGDTEKRVEASLDLSHLGPVEGEALLTGAEIEAEGRLYLGSLLSPARPVAVLARRT